MTKNISILGSTGSIGTQTLEVVDHLKNIRVLGLSTNRNIQLLEQQIRKYKPLVAAVMDKKSAQELKSKIRDIDTRVVVGQEGLIEVATLPQIEMLVTSVVGIVGLVPTLEAIDAKKNIALANKETLVTAGDLVMSKARKKKVSIIPVDSEHSAIFQCLQGNTSHKNIKNLIITASGGPFLGKDEKDLQDVTPTQALKHPKWNMGSKISIDSATLMNKGLEVIEARWLFDIGIDKIQVLVHPQSIIHSMVEYEDNSIIAQLGAPDMKVPIQYAMTYPKREPSPGQSLDFMQNNRLTLQQPDMDTFKCLRLAYDALQEGGTKPVVLNGANEIAVQLFLENKIKFIEIPQLISAVMASHRKTDAPSLEEIIHVDQWAREESFRYLNSTSKIVYNE